MIALGRWQTLKIVRKKEFGVYLSEDTKGEEAVLLPKKQVPAGSNIGDTIRVFVYKDSQDRMIATVHEPFITLDEMAVLKVVSVTSIGAFMDWGLEKNILLPFKEQIGKVSEGKEYLVRMYIDKSDRPCVSMKLYHHLEQNAPYEKDDSFKGIVYDYKADLGAFVAIDNRYSGMIPKSEIYGKVEIGDRVEGRVLRVREDGKLDLAIRKPAYLQMNEDSEAVLKVIVDSFDGVLPFDDKASPEIIKKEFGLSKNAFKRAVGKLLKEGKIQITDQTIKSI